MKVFVGKCHISYGGGMAVVVAKDIEEARDILRKKAEEWAEDEQRMYGNVYGLHWNDEIEEVDVNKVGCIFDYWQE